MSLLNELVGFIDDDNVVHRVDEMFDLFDTVFEQLSEDDKNDWAILDMEYEGAVLENDAEHAADILMAMHDILEDYGINNNPCFEVVYVDDDDNVLSEAQATVAYRASSKGIKKKFRCMAGEKKGRLVANPRTCITRKNPKRVVVGRRVASSKKGLRIRKSQITRGKNTSKMARKMNLRLKHMGTRRPKTK